MNTHSLTTHHGRPFTRVSHALFSRPSSHHMKPFHSRKTPAGGSAHRARLAMPRLHARVPRRARRASSARGAGRRVDARDASGTVRYAGYHPRRAARASAGEPGGGASGGRPRRVRPRAPETGRASRGNAASRAVFAAERVLPRVHAPPGGRPQRALAGGVLRGRQARRRGVRARQESERESGTRHPDGTPTDFGRERERVASIRASRAERLAPFTRESRASAGRGRAHVGGGGARDARRRVF